MKIIDEKDSLITSLKSKLSAVSGCQLPFLECFIIEILTPIHLGKLEAIQKTKELDERSYWVKLAEIQGCLEHLEVSSVLFRLRF